MNRKQIFDAQDPYSLAITSLVKKTLIVLGVCVLIFTGGVGYVAIKSGLKLSSSKKAVAEKPEPTTEVLAAITQAESEATPISTPTSLPTATPSVTATPSSAPTAIPSPSSQPTPSPQVSTGPSASPAASPNIQKITISATAAQDGYVDGKGTVNTAGELRVGNAQNTSLRSFISFNITSLDETKLVRGKLRIYQKGGKNNPFVTGNDIRGDIINYGSSLDKNDFGVSSINPSFIILTSNDTEGWKEIDITDSLIKSKRENRQLFQIRLHLSYENESKEAYTIFESADNTLGTSNVPQLALEIR